MKTIIAILIFVTSIKYASATVITLYCEGITRGSDIVDSPSSKVIELDTVSKRIQSVSPSPTACFIGKLQRKNTHLYDDSTDFSCLSDVAESYIKLSRYTLKLEEITRFIGRGGKKDNFWIGEFICTEKQRKF